MSKLFFALFALALTACGGGHTSSDADYFPAVQGATWTYRAKSWSELQPWTSVVSVTGTRQVQGSFAWVFEEINRKRPGDRYESFFAKDARAVTLLGDAPVSDQLMDAAPWDLLRFDGSGFGSTPLLDVKGVVAPDPFGGQATIDLKIAVGPPREETITTPAGTFATKVFSYTLTASAASASGIPFQTSHSLTEWRARGVGLVRQSYETGVQFASTNWVKDLVSYSIPSE